MATMAQCKPALKPKPVISRGPAAFERGPRAPHQPKPLPAYEAEMRDSATTVQRSWISTAQGGWKRVEQGSSKSAVHVQRSTMIPMFVPHSAEQVKSKSDENSKLHKPAIARISDLNAAPSSRRGGRPLLRSATTISCAPQSHPPVLTRSRSVSPGQPSMVKNLIAKFTPSATMPPPADAAVSIGKPATQEVVSPPASTSYSPSGLPAAIASGRSGQQPLTASIRPSYEAELTSRRNIMQPVAAPTKPTARPRGVQMSANVREPSASSKPATSKNAAAAAAQHSRAALQAVAGLLHQTSSLAVPSCGPEAVEQPLFTSPRGSPQLPVVSEAVRIPADPVLLPDATLCEKPETSMDAAETADTVQSAEASTQTPDAGRAPSRALRRTGRKKHSRRSKRDLSNDKVGAQLGRLVARGSRQQVEGKMSSQVLCAFSDSEDQPSLVEAPLPPSQLTESVPFESAGSGDSVHSPCYPVEMSAAQHKPLDDPLLGLHVAKRSTAVKRRPTGCAVLPMSSQDSLAHEAERKASAHETERQSGSVCDGVEPKAYGPAGGDICSSGHSASPQLLCNTIVVSTAAPLGQIESASCHVVQEYLPKSQLRDYEGWDDSIAPGEQDSEWDEESESDDTDSFDLSQDGVALRTLASSEAEQHTTYTLRPCPSKPPKTSLRTRARLAAMRIRHRIQLQHLELKCRLRLSTHSSFSAQDSPASRTKLHDRFQPLLKPASLMTTAPVLRRMPMVHGADSLDMPCGGAVCPTNAAAAFGTLWSTEAGEATQGCSSHHGSSLSTGVRVADSPPVPARRSFLEGSTPADDSISESVPPQLPLRTTSLASQSVGNNAVCQETAVAGRACVKSWAALCDEPTTSWVMADRTLTRDRPASVTLSSQSSRKKKFTITRRRCLTDSRKTGLSAPPAEMPVGEKPVASSDIIPDISRRQEASVCSEASAAAAANAAPVALPRLFSGKKLRHGLQTDGSVDHNSCWYVEHLVSAEPSGVDARRQCSTSSHVSSASSSSSGYLSVELPVDHLCVPLAQLTESDLLVSAAAPDSDDSLADGEPIYEFLPERPKEDRIECAKDDSLPAGNAPSQHSSGLTGRSEAPFNLLWCQMPQVKACGVLDEISPTEIKLQEAMFELLTSEASYLRSLDVLLSVFVNNPVLSNSALIPDRQRHILFCNIRDVHQVSQRLHKELDQHWQESIIMSDVCDILARYAQKDLDVYVKYCSNQGQQSEVIDLLSTTVPQYAEAIRELERSPSCRGLGLSSYLLLPMQRVTRYPLLVDAIMRRLEANTQHEYTARNCYEALKRIARKCNEAARLMEQAKLLVSLEKQLQFDEVRRIPIMSSSRYLIKKADLALCSDDVKGKGSTLTLMILAVTAKQRTRTVFLFSDLVLIAKKKKSGSVYTVVDYAPRAAVTADLPHDGVSGLCISADTVSAPAARSSTSLSSAAQAASPMQYGILLVLLQNHQKKHAEYLLGCQSESERERWLEALSPPSTYADDERIYESWDCPQVRVVCDYTTDQSGELELHVGDVVNVHRKMADGWYEGERISDGCHGWFPAGVTEELPSEHRRVKHLKQRYELLKAAASRIKAAAQASNDAQAASKKASAAATTEL